MVQTEEVMSEENNKLTKEWFIREIAERARFTIGDVRIIWNEIEEILKDIIYYENELVLPGLLKISVTTIKEHMGHNAVEDSPMLIPESKRVVFKASRALLEMLRNKNSD